MMSKTENQKNCKMRRVDNMILAVPPSFIGFSQAADTFQEGRLKRH